MARPRNDRQGIQTSLYLTPERQDRLATIHDDFRRAIYTLIDRIDAAKAPGVPSDAPEPQSAPEDDLQALEGPTVPNLPVPDRCKRVRCPGCKKCQPRKGKL